MMWPVVAWLMVMFRFWMSMVTGCPVQVLPMPMWCSRPALFRVMVPLLTVSLRIRVWVRCVGSPLGVAFGRAV